jgi:hypothetical protein
MVVRLELRGEVSVVFIEAPPQHWPRADGKNKPQSLHAVVRSKPEEGK